MKGYRGVLVAFALSPLAAMAQVPVMEGSSNNGSNAVYQGSSVTQQTQAGLSSESLNAFITKCLELGRGKQAR